MGAARITGRALADLADGMDWAPAGVASKSTAVMIANLVMAFDLDPLDRRGSSLTEEDSATGRAVPMPVNRHPMDADPHTEESRRLNWFGCRSGPSGLGVGRQLPWHYLRRIVEQNVPGFDLYFALAS